MPSETHLIVSFIEEKQYAIYTHKTISKKPLQEIKNSIYSQLFFCPSCLIKNLTFYSITETVYGLDYSCSPVVELNCCIMYQHGLSKGRLVFRGGYVGRDSWIWHDKILFQCYRIMKNYLNKNILTKNRKYGAFISHETKAYIELGGNLIINL